MRGGRVATTGFLDPQDAARLAAKLHGVGVSTYLYGGYPGAKRRVLTAFPEHIPQASATLMAVYFEGIHDAAELHTALRQSGLATESIGDIVTHQDGLTVIVLEQARDLVMSLSTVAEPLVPQEVGLEHLAKGRVRRQLVIVPSLRVDALGAKAFKVSRSYFSKGIAGGKVSVSGKPASKSTSAAPGDEVYAEGLGRFSIVGVQGETRRGNLKVELEIEQDRS